MNRLESIKDRLQKEFYVKSHPSWGKDESASEDINYLLQRLERYEAALNKIGTTTELSFAKFYAFEALKEE